MSLSAYKHILLYAFISFLTTLSLHSIHIIQYHQYNHDQNPIIASSNHRILLQSNKDNSKEKTKTKNEILTQELRLLIKGTYDDVHTVVTTGCSGYQNWQFETLLYSWSAIRQPGRFTRIIAGCKTEEEKLKANKTAIPNEDGRISFYFVKDYSPEKKSGGRPFWYFNKPFGFNEWLNDPSNIIYESVIILIDPDFIILKPFLFHIKAEAEKIAKELSLTTPERQDGKPRIRDLWVRKGHPVSQKYGIGAKWVANNWTGFCDEVEYKGTDCQDISARDAWNYYSVGPPYMMHIDDWKIVAPKWMEYSPNALVWDPPPSILAEMYSFVIACAIFDLRHEYLLSMVSHPDSNKYMENTFDIEVDDADHFKFHILHYCHGYWLGKSRNHGTIRNGGWNFHKGHVPADYLYDCDIPLMVEMGDGVEGSDDALVMFKERDYSKIENQYGMVWTLRLLVKRINTAVLNYRLTYCEKGWEPSYVLVLQQPEASDNGRRMNYVLGNYSNEKSWKGA